MSDAARQARVLAVLADLLRLPLETPEREALLAAIDGAVELTGSRIGYLHYLNEDQVTIELSTWSTGTRDYCTAAHDRHYPLDVAGIWADTARTRTSHVHNDYPSAPQRRGLPDGHSVLLRHLGVPALDAAGQVRLLMGVGNKAGDYDEQDVVVAQAVVDEAWRVVRRLRRHQGVVRDLELLRSRQGPAGLVTWEWDPVVGTVAWDAQVDLVLGPPNPQVAVGGWERVLAGLDAASQARLRRGLEVAATAATLDLELRGSRGDGSALFLRLVGERTDRPQGLGHVFRGTLLDVSLQEEVARARHRATHDALTGLPNRAWLLEEVTRVLSGPSAGGLVVHVLDIDGFKTVNDEHGHLVGDDVLRTCADRLSALARGADRAVRLGGDVFAVLQPPATDADAARRLAGRIVDAVSRPIESGRADVRVGAAVGIAVARPGEDARAVLGRANRALHEAKRSRTPVLLDPDDAAVADAGVTHGTS